MSAYDSSASVARQIKDRRLLIHAAILGVPFDFIHGIETPQHARSNEITIVEIAFERNAPDGYQLCEGKIGGDAPAHFINALIKHPPLPGTLTLAALDQHIDRHCLATARYQPKP